MYLMQEMRDINASPSIQTGVIKLNSSLSSCCLPRRRKRELIWAKQKKRAEEKIKRYTWVSVYDSVERLPNCRRWRASVVGCKLVRFNESKGRFPKGRVSPTSCCCLSASPTCSRPFLAISCIRLVWKRHADRPQSGLRARGKSWRLKTCPSLPEPGFYPEFTKEIWNRDCYRRWSTSAVWHPALDLSAKITTDTFVICELKFKKKDEISSSPVSWTRHINIIFLRLETFTTPPS